MMSWDTVIRTMVAFLCLTLVVIHIMVWNGRCADWVSLIFFLMAVATSVKAHLAFRWLQILMSGKPGAANDGIDEPDSYLKWFALKRGGKRHDQCKA